MPQSKVEHIAPEGHTIHTLMEEHQFLLDLTQKLINTVNDALSLSGFDEAQNEIKTITSIAQHYREAERHYLREENVLFPLLEKHGITGPPAQMWNEHEQIRTTEKEMFAVIDAQNSIEFKDFLTQISTNAQKLNEILNIHYQKENTILFPMALNTLNDDEWQDVTNEFNVIGYCCFSPSSVRKKAETTTNDNSASIENNLIDTGSGKLTLKQLKTMLSTLPVEITFVDKDDTFIFYNKVEDPIFVRTNASLGLKVQRCHPQKSVHLVNQVISDFKSGAKDMVEFWINMGEKYVYIRYFAVRDESGEYLGCMEVTQDIKDIQKITGEKRL